MADQCSDSGRTIQLHKQPDPVAVCAWQVARIAADAPSLHDAGAQLFHFVQQHGSSSVPPGRAAMSRAVNRSPACRMRTGACELFTCSRTALANTTVNRSGDACGHHSSKAGSANRSTQGGGCCRCARPAPARAAWARRHRNWRGACARSFRAEVAVCTDHSSHAFLLRPTQRRQERQRLGRCQGTLGRLYRLAAVGRRCRPALGCTSAPASGRRGEQEGRRLHKCRWRLENGCQEDVEDTWRNVVGDEKDASAQSCHKEVSNEEVSNEEGGNEEASREVGRQEGFGKKDGRKKGGLAGRARHQACFHDHGKDNGQEDVGRNTCGQEDVGATQHCQEECYVREGRKKSHCQKVCTLENAQPQERIALHIAVSRTEVPGQEACQGGGPALSQPGGQHGGCQQANHQACGHIGRREEGGDEEITAGGTLRHLVMLRRRWDC